MGILESKGCAEWKEDLGYVAGAAKNPERNEIKGKELFGAVH